MHKKILIIDDDPAIRKSFTLSLEDLHYETQTVPSGEQGIEAIKKRPYDLIYLDLKMPGLNGVETLRRIREIDDKVPIYIITAFHGEFFHELRQAQRDGISFDLLRKPISLDEIAAISHSLLSGAILSQESELS